MPSEDGQPETEVPAIELIAGLHLSPYELFRKLKEGRAPLLFDLRPEAGESPAPVPTLLGSRPLADLAFELAPGVPAVLFDDDGRGATRLARELQAAGRTEVRALFGGLRLYDFALDPAVVGDERFLR
jgi:hypothetical protein